MKSIFPKPEMLVGIAALASSFLSLYFYIKQTNIMEAQQKASAWPHLEWSYSNGDNLSLDVKNKGVGPATVDYFVYKYDGKPYWDLGSLIKKVLKRDFSHYNSSLPNKVISPQENVRVIYLNDSKEAAMVYDSLFGSPRHNFEMKICYTSIYGEHFISTGFSAKPCKSCDSLTVANFK